MAQVDIAKLAERGESLAELASAMGGYHVQFFGHVKGRYGNALLSRHPIVKAHEVHLRGGTEVMHNGQPYRIHRGLLACEVDAPMLPQGTVIACTHLDHIIENERVMQLAHVVESLHQIAPHGAVALLGDLNALTRSDYSTEEWGALQRHNRKKGWAPPSYGCLDLLSQQGFSDCCEQAPGSSAHWTAHVAHPRYRIDYVWLGEGLQKHVEVVNCAVATHVRSSDHFPLAVDLRSHLLVSEGGKLCASL